MCCLCVSPFVGVFARVCACLCRLVSVCLCGYVSLRLFPLLEICLYLVCTYVFPMPDICMGICCIVIPTAVSGVATPENKATHWRCHL